MAQIARGKKPSRLRSWRGKERLTLREIAGLTGFSSAMISLVENGHRTLSREGKILLARRLGVPVQTLFEPEPVDEAELVAR